VPGPHESQAKIRAVGKLASAIGAISHRLQRKHHRSQVVPLKNDIGVLDRREPFANGDGARIDSNDIGTDAICDFCGGAGRTLDLPQLIG